jgi:hypothetical protein
MKKPDSETRFVGVRMENGIKTVRTFGYARNPQGKIEEVYSMVQNQRTVSQEWTGVTFTNERAAAAASWHANRAAIYEV